MQPVKIEDKKLRSISVSTRDLLIEKQGEDGEFIFD